MITHKRDFRAFQARYEAKGEVFYDRLSDVIDTDRDISVGDLVEFRNDYGIIFGPYEVLAFQKPTNGGRCVYFDHNAFWFPARPDQLTLIRKGGLR
jgi:hypothetical protein